MGNTNVDAHSRLPISLMEILSEGGVPIIDSVKLGHHSDSAHLICNGTALESGCKLVFSLKYVYSNYLLVIIEAHNVLGAVSLS